MLTPILCFTCGCPIGDVAPLFRRLRAARAAAALAARGTAPAQAATDYGLTIDCSDILESLGVLYDCCRAHLVTAMDYRDYY